MQALWPLLDVCDGNAKHLPARDDTDRRASTREAHSVEKPIKNPAAVTHLKALLPARDLAFYYGLAARQNLISAPAMRGCRRSAKAVTQGH
jgi:hypothetical protein